MKDMKRWDNEDGNYFEFRFDDDKLRDLLREVGQLDAHAARVGIFGKPRDRKVAGALKRGGGHKTGKSAAPLTNAEVGFINEFGSADHKHPPARSWLRMPLWYKAEQIVKKASNKLLESLAGKSSLPFYNALGVEAEGTIIDAFNSGGFGAWKGLSDSTIAYKKSDAILIDTGQLRRAVAHEVI